MNNNTLNQKKMKVPKEPVSTLSGIIMHAIISSVSCKVHSLNRCM